MPNLTENEWLVGDLPEGEGGAPRKSLVPETVDAGPTTNDEGRTTFETDAPSIEDAPGERAEEVQAAEDGEAGAEVVTELDVTEADPIVQAEMQEMVAEVGYLVGSTFEAHAAADDLPAAEEGAALDLPPLFLGDVYLPKAENETEAVAVAVEAVLQAEEVAAPDEPLPAVTVEVEALVTPEADVGNEGGVALAAPGAGEPVMEAERPLEEAPAAEEASGAETGVAAEVPAAAVNGAVADTALAGSAQPGASVEEVPAVEAAPDKPKRRGKKAREPKAAAPVTVAEAVEGLSAASVAASEPPVTMGTLPVMGDLSLVALVESLLFVADGAVPVSRLAEALEIHPREVEAALASLAESYQQRGLSLQRFRDKVQLTTSPAAAGLVERFLGLAASTPLSRAALEALAIVAYQQPVTRPQIESVRGVNSDSVIKNLLTKGLIEESGRAEGPGRPVLYSTTPEFMQHFGLASLSDLPALTPPSAEAAGETISELLKG